MTEGLKTAKDITRGDDAKKVGPADAPSLVAPCGPSQHGPAGHISLAGQAWALRHALDAAIQACDAKEAAEKARKAKVAAAARAAGARKMSARRRTNATGGGGGRGGVSGAVCAGARAAAAARAAPIRPCVRQGGNRTLPPRRPTRGARWCP